MDRLRRLSSGFYGLLVLAMTMAIGFGSVWSGEFLMRLASSFFMAVSGVLYLLYFLVDADLLPRFGRAGLAGGKHPQREGFRGLRPLSLASGVFAVRKKMVWVRVWVWILVTFAILELFVFPSFLTFLVFD